MVRDVIIKVMPSAIQYEPKPLPFNTPLTGISDKAMTIHHDKLYVGYVNKMKEVADQLHKMKRALASIRPTRVTRIFAHFA